MLPYIRDQQSSLGIALALSAFPASPQLRPSENNSNIELLQSSMLSHVVFVCIDFENVEEIKSRAPCCTRLSRGTHAELGVSLLDTRTLYGSVSPQEAIQSHNFTIGGSTSAARKFGNRFLFGKTQRIRLPQLINTIEQLLDRDRNIILVGHGFSSDWNVLKVLGVDLETSIAGIIDTEHLARQLFPKDARKCRLKDLLTQLNCPFHKLHCAGNDAHFSLRALLLLATLGYADSAVDDVTRNKLNILQAIGQAPLLPPYLATPTPLTTPIADGDGQDSTDEDTRPGT